MEIGVRAKSLPLVLAMDGVKAAWAQVSTSRACFPLRIEGAKALSIP